MSIPNYTKLPRFANEYFPWTEPRNADPYEAPLAKKVLPDLRDIPGYVLRSDGPAESEFIVIDLFDLLESVKAFAGDDTARQFEPKAHALLSRIEPLAHHCEVRATGFN